MPNIDLDAVTAVDALRAGRVKEAHAAVARASTRFRALSDDAVAEAPMDALLVGHAQLAHERFPAAVETLDRGLRALKDAEQRHLSAALAMTRAVALTPMLRLDQAKRDLELSEEFWREADIGQHLLVVLVQQAVVAELRGDADALAETIAESRRLMATLPESQATRARECRLAALGAAEDPERCIDDVLRAGGTDLEVLDPTTAVQLMGVLIEACLAARRRADAEQWAARMSRRAAHCGLPLGRARARTARAWLLLGIGDGAGAAELALLSATLCERLRALADELTARLCAARGLISAGQDRAAEAELFTVVEQADQRQAKRFREEAIGLLRYLGVAVYDAPADPAEIVERLSPRERQVMDLVVAGHSNEDVAIVASLSEDAVEDHLSAVYNKLGARTRGELSAFAARLAE